MALSQSYRKLRLKNLEALRTESLLLAPIFHALWRRCQAGDLEPSELCYLQIFLFLALRRPGRPILRRRSASPSNTKTTLTDNSPSIRTISELTPVLEAHHLRSLRDHSIKEVLNTFDFLCVPLGIQRALRYWVDHPEQIVLQTAIPSPEEVLEIQSQGRRVVTTFYEQADLATYHNGKEPLEFLLHDLEHADKFFCETGTLQGQTQFFAELLHLYRSHELKPWMRADAVFRKQLEYLMADMNSHPAHLQKYFRAIVLNHLLRKEGKLESDVLSPQGQSSLLQIERRMMFQDGKECLS